MDRRTFDVYYDVANDVFLNMAGETLGQSKLWPFITYQEESLMLLHLVDGSVDVPYAALGGAATFTAAVDTDFNNTTTLMCKTFNDGINASGDWEDADKGEGLLSIRVNTATASFRDAVGTSAEVAAYFELTAYGTGGQRLAVIRFSIIARNLVDADGATVTALTANTAAGSVTIAEGAVVATVTGLTRDVAPTVVLCTVRKPAAGGLNIFATVRGDTLTATGFTVDLSGATGAAGYKLDYMALYL